MTRPFSNGKIPLPSTPVRPPRAVERPRLWDRLPFYLFCASLAITLTGGAFVYGVIAQRAALPPAPQLTAAYETLRAGGSWREHVQPARGQGRGVTVNETGGDGALVLMAGFFEDENQIRLIDRDGTVLRRWSLDYLAHFPDREARPCDLSDPLRVDTHGLHLTQQGEVLFNYEYCGTVKLDPCGAVRWTLPRMTHHSLTPAAGGGYWVLGHDRWWSRSDPDRFAPFSAAPRGQLILEDTVLRVSAEGEVLEDFSLPAMMVDNGLEALMTAYGQIAQDGVPRNELVHANKIAELPAAIAGAYPLFEAGDLAVSLRGLNLVLVFDPVSRKVKWHRTGPWLRQHDPEFRPDGRISIFNNNVYETAYVDGQTDLGTPFSTNIIVIDPVTGETEVVFGERPGEEMLSVIRGQHELLDTGGMLITEFDAGRVLEVTRDRDIVWEYVNAYDDALVGEISNALLYPAGYLDGADTGCPL